MSDNKMYLSAGDGFELKTDFKSSELINDFVEMYTFEFKKAYEADREVKKSVNKAYEVGKFDGAVEALSVLGLQILGGKQMYELWRATSDWCNKNEKDDNKLH